MVVQCPYCHYKEMVPEEYAGMQGECSNCGRDYLLQKQNATASYPVACFAFGFFFSLIGILVAYVIDKKNVGKALLGFAVSLVFWFFIVGGATCASRVAARNAASAASALSEEEGDRAKSAAELIDQDSLKQLGED